MLKIFLGDRQSDASENMLKELIKESTEAPGESFIAIVPEQATLQMQRKLCMLHPDHVVMNTDVTSFERLAGKVFEELGEDSGKLLNDTGKVLILRKVLEQSRDELDVYSKKVHMLGFADAMQSVISELAQYNIDDNELFLMQESAQERSNDLLKKKLQDIRLIRQKFYDTISDKYSTSEIILKAFARLSGKSSIIRNTHIYLDGFTGFTSVQYVLLEALMKTAADINVSLVLPERFKKHQNLYSPSDMFYLSNRTYQRLTEIAHSCVEQVRDIRDKSDENIINTPEPRVHCGSDQIAEVTYIAGMILKGVRNEGKRFRDYAVICADMDSYYNLFRNIFSKADIPCFIDYKSELGDNALARYIICAMNIVNERFSYESIFAFLKNLLCGFDDDELSRLENYCLEFGIKGYAAWNKDFEKNRKLKGSDRMFWDLDTVNQSRKRVLHTLKDFYLECSESNGNTGVYCSALKNLLERNGIKEKSQALASEFRDSSNLSKAMEYEQIYDTVLNVLEQMSELMGNEQISRSDFTQMLSAALEDIKIGIIPPSLDQVVVGDLTRTRLGNVKVLFMSGMNDGKIPTDSRMKGLLTERERLFLSESDFELAPAFLENLYTQYFYIYLMISKPSEGLYLTYAASNAQGEELSPSCILDEIEQSLQTGTGLPENGETEQIWGRKAARILADHIRKYASDMKLNDSAVLCQDGKRLVKYFSLSDPKILKQILDGAFFENRALPIDEETALNLYGEKLKGSVSRYEKYYECPFKHFLNYGLRITERPVYEVLQTDIGTIYHDSLEIYAKEIKEKGMTFRDISDEDSHAIAQECIDRAADRIQSDVLSSTKRSEYLLKRMTNVLLKTTDILRLHVRQGLYEPSDFEMEFYDDKHEKASFKGKIDRVDIYDGSDVYVKIIDYKSGNKKFSIKDIYTGQQLQLVAYLSQAIKIVQDREPDRNVRAGGVYYYLVQDRFVRDEKEAKEKFRMSGITSCEPEALNAIDTEIKPGSASEVVEINYTKTGLSSRSKVANDLEFANLMKFTDNKIEYAGNEIMRGDVSIHPSYESAQKNACTYCEYMDVCKFEPGKWGCDYNTLAQEADSEEMEKEIYGRN